MENPFPTDWRHYLLICVIVALIDVGGDILAKWFETDKEPPRLEKPKQSTVA